MTSKSKIKKNPDRKLVLAAKQGDKHAAGRLVRRYQDRVLALAYDYLGSYEEARDAAQEVFIKALSGLSGFTESSKFSTWIYRITVNHCLDERRKKQRRKKLLERDLRDVAGLPDDSLETAGIDLERAGLSTAQRSALILRYYQDLSIPDIAAIMDCSENTVRTHIYRGITKLRGKSQQRP